MGRLIPEVEKELVKQAMENKKHHIVDTGFPGDDNITIDVEGVEHEISIDIVGEANVTWVLYKRVQDEDGGSHGEEVDSGIFNASKFVNNKSKK